MLTTTKALISNLLPVTDAAAREGATIEIEGLTRWSHGTVNGAAVIMATDYASGEARITVYADREVALHLIDASLDLRSVDSEAWSTRGRYTERDLRAAVGLPVNATWSELRAAMEARGGEVDLDLLDIFEWKRDHGEEARIQNSIEWAEQWRARQQMRVAAAAMGRAIELAREVMPGQRELWPGL